MNDEVMEERRRLFLQEMARVREREQNREEPIQVPSEWRTDPPPPKVYSPASPRPITHIALLVLCLALTFPIFSYGRRQAEGQAALQSKRQAALDEQNFDAWRRERVARARSFFDLPAIMAVRRSDADLFLILKPGLSHAEIVVQAWHVRNVLSGRVFQSPLPHPWRIVFCSGNAPCTVSLSAGPSEADSEAWRVIENEKAVASTLSGM